MADENHGALIIVESGKKLSARINIEVVGRLVQNQKIGLVERRQCQHQPRPLATGEFRDIRPLFIGREAEATQLGTQLLFAQLRPQAGQCGDRRDRTVQFFKLMLGEIAGYQLARPYHFAAHRRQFLHQQFCQGRFAVAVLAQKRDAVVRVEPHGHIGKDRLSRFIADGDPVHGDQRRARFLALRDTDGRDVFVQRHIGEFQFRDHFHARLCLLCLVLFVAEAVDEGLHMGARCFLLLVEGKVVGALLGANFGKGVVIAGVKRQLAVFEVQDEFGRRVQQIAIMADDQNRTAIAFQEVLKPQHPFKVEVVGRLVQKKQIRGGKENRSERHAHPPAAGKFRTGAQLVRRRKTQSRQNGGGARGRGIGIDRFQPRVDFAQPVRVSAAFAFGQEVRPLGIGGQDCVQKAGRPGRGFLRHRAEPGLGRQGDIAAVATDFALDQLEQGGLAGAVTPHEPDATPFGQACAGAFQDVAPGNAIGQVFDYQHDGTSMMGGF